MSPHMQKQPVLKPQDLVVVLKVAVNRHRDFTFAELGRELSMSASEVHAACLRAELSRLLLRSDEGFDANRTALQEFAIYGVRYAFPPVIGAVTRGMATGVGAHPLKNLFMQTGESTPVWPDADGQSRGQALIPLYPSVPKACGTDSALYEMLVLVDAIRGGAAREREIAEAEIIRRLQS